MYILAYIYLFFYFTYNFDPTAVLIWIPGAAPADPPRAFQEYKMYTCITFPIITRISYRLPVLRKL